MWKKIRQDEINGKIHIYDWRQKLWVQKRLLDIKEQTELLLVLGTGMMDIILSNDLKEILNHYLM